MNDAEGRPNQGFRLRNHHAAVGGDYPRGLRVADSDRLGFQLRFGFDVNPALALGELAVRRPSGEIDAVQSPVCLWVVTGKQRRRWRDQGRRERGKKSDVRLC
jgi:hypothetical protein